MKLARASELVDELWKTARTLLESGRIAEAVASYDEALAAAAECGSQELRDAVFSGRAAALAEVGRGDEVLTELHAILLRSKRRSTRLRAAYTSAGIYELRGDASRARRYALRARALGEGEPAGSRALVESLLGNLLAADSRFAEAEAAYTRALELDPGAPEYFRMVDLENIGYCKAASGRVADGLVLLHRALTFFRSNDIPECEVTALTDVCHALLMSRRPEEARLAGERGLALVERSPDPKARRNLLYLLAVACHESGDERGASHYVDRLIEIRPDLASIRDRIVSSELLGMLNLRSLS